MKIRHLNDDIVCIHIDKNKKTENAKEERERENVVIDKLV